MSNKTLVSDVVKLLTEVAQIGLGFVSGLVLKPTVFVISYIQKSFDK
jgi:hypothetical protein